ncbi:glycosyltransferase family 2 protein [Pedobacter endophyticus]|uniref:Glycosyltransferase n=1 Tax=Pedobacter endophyticus TaxID=2789740 RepID=A0A7U3SQX1_9SPHI|nr:glycosyltransferase [Pedobacter endophyticus]QPH38831.1 glycosyltransferase [Pedobacter endophyticus]
MPIISIIVPNYNHSAYLKQRLASVFNQSFQDFEVIILDDCSTDDSKTIIEQYRFHEKVSHVIYNEINSGSPFEQWEKGINLAKGDWIWIAESDDVAEKEFLETVFNNAKTDDDIVLSYCASWCIDKNGKKETRLAWADDISERNWLKDFRNDGLDEINTQFFYKNVIPNASAVLFKKKSIDTAVFRLIANMRFAGDWLFWIKLLESGKVCYSAKILNNFRYHDSTTRNIKNASSEKQRFEEYFSVLNYLNKNNNKVRWNFKKHKWIMKEWLERYKLIKGSTSLPFNIKFPFTYNIALLFKFMKRSIASVKR